MRNKILGETLLLERLNSPELDLDITYDPSGGVRALLDGEPIPDVREAIIVLTSHRSGAEVKLRLHFASEGMASEWRDIILSNPAVYARVTPGLKYTREEEREGETSSEKVESAA